MHSFAADYLEKMAKGDENERKDLQKNRKAT